MKHLLLAAVIIFTPGPISSAQTLDASSNSELQVDKVMELHQAISEKKEAFKAAQSELANISTTIEETAQSLSEMPPETLLQKAMNLIMSFFE